LSSNLYNIYVPTLALSIERKKWQDDQLCSKEDTKHSRSRAGLNAVLPKGYSKGAIYVYFKKSLALKRIFIKKDMVKTINS